MEKCGIIDQLREPKLLDMSLFDWILSLFGAILIGRFIGVRGTVWFAWLIFWIALGVGIHYLMGVPTTMGYYLGLNDKPKKKQCKNIT